MRLVSVLALVAIVGGAVFVFVFKPEWVRSAKKKGEEAMQSLSGYGPAKTPREAMDQFAKAVKERDYKAAALYVTNDYADKLRRAHTAARDLGRSIDSLNTFIDEKGFKTDKCTQLLLFLDPFPPYLKVADVKEADGKQYGVFTMEPPKIEEGYRPDELVRLSEKLYKYQNALGAPLILGPVEIKNEGQGESKAWKLDFKVPQVVHDGIDFYMNNYKSYLEGLDTFRGEVRQGRYLKDKIAPELYDTLSKSK